MENDLAQVWRLVAEFWDKLAHNRAITASLQAQAGSVKSAASHQITGFALRRFNMHMTQEAYDAELERLNATFIQRNSDLQNDNKQLAALLKEYEQTLETVMNKFRTHAHDSQLEELALTRHYESLLLSRETSVLSSDLLASTAYSHTLARIANLLRSALRASGGELPEDETVNTPRDVEREEGGYMEGPEVDDWALERESELARLEYENFELRRMHGVPPPLSPQSYLPQSTPHAEVTVEGDGEHGGLGVLTGPLHPEPGDEPNTQAEHLAQIPLGRPMQSRSHTQPLHIAFPPRHEPRHEPRHAPRHAPRHVPVLAQWMAQRDIHETVNADSEGPDPRAME